MEEVSPRSLKSQALHGTLNYEYENVEIRSSSLPETPNDPFSRRRAGASARVCDGYKAQFPSEPSAAQAEAVAPFDEGAVETLGDLGVRGAFGALDVFAAALAAPLERRALLLLPRAPAFFEGRAPVRPALGALLLPLPPPALLLAPLPPAPRAK